MMFIKTILLSVRRRKKEIRFVSLVTFIAVFCMSSISLFQNVMNRYLMETNYKNYGEWVLSSATQELTHPYFSISGDCNVGAEIIDQKGSATGEYLGSVDQNFQELANLSLYEGRLPQKENEIALPLTVLAKLGYDFELGQRIHVTVQLEEETLERDFVLSGTIKDFSHGWISAEGYALPSCIITKDSLMDMGGISYTTHFYQIDRKYEEISMEEFCAPFLQKATAETPVTYNSYVYDNQIWGSEDMFQNMQRILIVIAVLVMSYLMMSYVAKRRKWYYQMRSTGAGRVQVWMMIAIEGIYGTVPWAIFGLGLPYIIGVSACQVVAEKLQLPNFFEMDLENLILQIGIVFGIIVISIIAACVNSGDKQLSNNVHEVTKCQLNRLRKVVRKPRNIAANFLKRQNKMQPLQRIALIIFTVTISGVLILCVNMLYGKYQDYSKAVDGVYDYTARKIVEHEINYTTSLEDDAGTYSYPSADIYCGMDEQLEKQIEVLEGIRELKKEMFDENHYLEWEGKENSPIFQKTRENVTQGMQILEGEEDVLNGLIYMSFFYCDDFNQAIEKYGSLLREMQIDETAFNSGAEIVVILGEELFADFDETGNMKEIWLQETTLKTGDLVQIKSKQTSLEFPVKVVVRTLTQEEKLVEFADECGKITGPYNIIASQELMNKLAEAEGKKLQYNELFINFEPNTSFQSTTKRLASLLQESGFYYGPDWEWKTEERNLWIRNLCIYGTLLLVILSVYLILQMNLNQMKNYDRAKKYQMLKRLGMSDRFFVKMIIKDGFKDALWLLPGIALGYGLFALMEWVSITKEIGTEKIEFFSSYLGEYTDSVFWMAMQSIYEDTSFACSLVFIILLMAIVIGIVYLSAKQAMKKEGNIL